VVLLVPSGRRLRHDSVTPYGPSEEEHKATAQHSTGAAHHFHGLIQLAHRMDYLLVAEDCVRQGAAILDGPQPWGVVSEALHPLLQFILYRGIVGPTYKQSVVTHKQPLARIIHQPKN